MLDILKCHNRINELDMIIKMRPLTINEELVYSACKIYLNKHDKNKNVYKESPYIFNELIDENFWYLSS
jgi:hypothetical protein